MSDVAKCKLCGEPMPAGEEMFNYHGYSGDCPKPPLAKPSTTAPTELPPLDAPTQEDLDRSHLLCGLGTRIEVAHRELQGTWLHLQCRERQLLAAFRENQQLRQQVTAAQALASEEEESKNAVIMKLEVGK